MKKKTPNKTGPSPWAAASRLPKRKQYCVRLKRTCISLISVGTNTFSNFLLCNHIGVYCLKTIKLNNGPGVHDIRLVGIGFAP